jgi:hypothetical protein
MGGANEEGRRAADEATSPVRLLPGEPDFDVTNLEDVRHWQAVYAELVRSKGAILTTAEQRLEDSTGPEVADELTLDRSLLRQELDRLRARLSYWSGRERELASPSS